MMKCLLIVVTKYSSKGFPCLLNIDNVLFAKITTSQIQLHMTMSSRFFRVVILFLT